MTCLQDNLGPPCRAGCVHEDVVRKRGTEFQKNSSAIENDDFIIVFPLFGYSFRMMGML